MSAPAPSTGNAADDTSGAAADRTAVGGSAVPAAAVDAPADATVVVDAPADAAVTGQPVPVPRAKADAVDGPGSLAEVDQEVAGQAVPVPRATGDVVDESASPEDIHQDVAAFALGVLDDQQSIRFAAHLAACTRCADELDGLLATRDALAEIDADHLATAEQILGDGHLWGQIVERAPEFSRPSSYRPRVAFVAAVIGSAVLAIVGLVAVIVALG